MPFLDIYKAQVDLLLRCLPVVARAEALALKGGTAINLFHLDMPRLSVDIDLTYLPVEDRAVSIAKIGELLRAMAGEIQTTIPLSQTRLSRATAPKLFVQTPGANIKIEPNINMRGSLFEPVPSELCAEAQTSFEIYVSSRDSTRQTCTQARYARRWTVNIPGISLMSCNCRAPATFLTEYVKHLLRTSRVIVDQSQSCWHPIADQ